MNKFIENDIYNLQAHMESCKNCTSFKKNITDLAGYSYNFFMKRFITNAAITLLLIAVIIKLFDFF